MRMKKKIGIGFGIVIGLFFAMIIAAGVALEIEKANMTPEELQQWEKEREEERLIREQKAEAEKLQKEIEAEQERKTRELTEQNEKRQAEIEEAMALQKEDAKLNDEELQMVISGFESYNESVKALLDMCANVESENDYRLLGLLIAESGDDFLEITSGYGAIRNILMAEGYGEHPVLGPLMLQSEILVDGMSTCMEVLAWEFSG